MVEAPPGPQVGGSVPVPARPPASSSRPWADVPADVAQAVRIDMGLVAAHVIDMIRQEVPEYRPALEGAFGDGVLRGMTVALDKFVEMLGRDIELPPLDLYYHLGRGEERAGRPLDSLQAAYRVGARAAWRQVVDIAHAQGIDPVVLYRLAEAIFAYVDRIAAESVAGYAAEQSARAGAAQAKRQTLVVMLARRPKADPQDVERAAQLANWPLPTTLAAVAVGALDPVRIARRGPSGTIGASLPNTGVLLVPDPDGPGRPAALARGLETIRATRGPTVPWADAARSLMHAVTAWPLHERGVLGDDAVARTDQHLLALLLVSDPVLSRDLVDARLGPLLAMPEPARERAEKTLRAWLESHGDVSATADTLHVHAQTVRYRLTGLRQAFGEALDDPQIRLEIAVALRALDQLPR